MNKQNETLNKQIEILNKQTEMIGELKNIIVEESRTNRELLERINRKISK